MSRSKVVITIFLSFFGSELLKADDATPSLRDVMIKLENSLIELNKSILLEDYKGIASAAGNIARHPKPKNDLPIVVKTLGAEIKEFKKFDSIVHKSAEEIVGLAKSRNLQSILKKNSLILTNCANCHVKFRKKIAKVLSNRK